MAKARKKEEDAPVDLFGRPLPLVKLAKNGVEVDVRDAAALSNLHYGQGFGFVDDDLTYSLALAQLLGEDVAHEVVVEVPTEGGDFSWPQPDEGQDEDVADGDEDSGAKSGGRKGTGKSH